MHSESKTAELVIRCFYARTNAHVQHLTTKSYAQHIALGDFYDAIASLADELAETFQGRYGLLSYPHVTGLSWNKGPLRCLEELEKWIEQNRDEVCTDSDIQNQIDNIASLISRTVYKLENLK